MDSNLDSEQMSVSKEQDESSTVSLEKISSDDSIPKADNDEISSYAHEDETLNEPAEPSVELPLSSTDDLSFSHSNLEASEAPPLQLFDNDSKTMDEDSVFGGELAEIPDQILAETEEPDEPISNIEDELRNLEGSEEEEISHVPILSCNERIDNLVDALCDSGSSKPAESDEKMNADVSSLSESEKVAESINVSTLSLPDNSSNDAFEQVDLNSMEKEKSLNIEDNDVLSDDRTQTAITAVSLPDETHNDESMEAESSQSGLAPDDHLSIPEKTARTEDNSQREEEDDKFDSKNASIEDVEMSSIENQTETSENIAAVDDPLISQVDHEIDDKTNDENEDVEMATVEKQTDSSEKNDAEGDLEREDGDDLDCEDGANLDVTKERTENDADKGIATDTAQENSNIEENEPEDLTTEPQVDYPEEFNSTADIADDSNKTTDESAEKRPRSITRLYRKSESSDADKTIERRSRRRGISNSPVSGILESNKKKDVSNPQPSRSRRRFRNLDGSSEHSTPDNSTTRSKSGDEADDTVELNELKELQIKELDRDLTDEKCSRCRKVKQCRYKYMQNGDIKYLCNLKCVDGFRTTSKEPYQLIARRIVISLIFESVYYCEQCKKKKNCRYRFKMPPDDNFVYICDAQCFNQYVGKNVEKYFRRRKTYLVQENENGDTEKLCIHCCETKLCKYSFKDDDNSVYHICSDDCFNLLAKEENDRFKLKRRSVRVRDLGAPITTSPPAVTSEPKIIARSEQEAEAARLDREATFIRRCAECLRTPDQQMLEWETVHFCNDICLEKYQKVIGATCTTCARAVPTISMGKYCVRFGFEIRQFCTAGCLDTFKKGLKVCSFCQKDISHDKDGFLAPVGEKSQFKDFCSQDCMKSYDDVLNPRKKQNTRNCAVCNIDRVVRVEIILDNRDFEFCSNPCFSAFKFVNNISPDECAMCLKYFERKSVESYTLYVEGVAKVFCRKICMNIFIILNRKIVSCRWCKVKKYNFDMILTNQGGQVSMLCSVNCLRQFSSLGNAALVVRLQKICDQCHKNGTPMYNLSMSDSTLRNFCTYQCVMAFQGSYTRPTTDAAGNIMLGAKTPYPVGLPKKIATKDKDSPLPQIQVAATTSLAIHHQSKQDQSININSKRGRPRRRKQAAPEVSQASEIDSSTLPLVALSSGKTAQKLPVSTVTCHTQTTRIGKKTVGVNTIENAPKNQIVTIPQVQPTMVNKQTMCKPSAEMLAQQARRPTCTVECQTDASLERKFFIPIPVPIYVPQPMHMYSLPVPIPVPFPLPIPVPIFIPTTRNSAEGIMKEIKKIQDKMPSDPFEAELLMMAEMVAGEKKQNESDSEPEDDADEAAAVVEFVPDTETTSNFGEDVLQMALKLATEYEEPAVDLESAMQTNTITQSAPQLEEVIDEDLHQQHLIMIDPQRQIMGAVRNPRKRAISPSGGMPRNHRLSATPQQKRQRLQHIVSPTNAESIRNSTEQTEKPDAHMCLKYTFGVNAWKQWVMTKNSDLEKSSIRRKPFKSELLQLTADELNYSLCLFVKEVRKPNGSEYAPDTIYYLVLGIQQYLYENERIDNIFTDPYYERFTDCLDEVSRRFSVLYNDSQYIVTRVEEEHLWECKQLGAHSPHVLLSTLMFFNTKHFNLTTVDEHMQLSFSHIMKHWKRSPPGTKTQGSRNVLLRFYPPQTGPEANPRKKKVYEQQENESDPLRCPVKLYEFYLSKCPESVKTRSDVFYLQPERSCVPDSPVWYSTQPLSRDALIKMLHRVKMVKEINIALLSS